MNCVLLPAAIFGDGGMTAEEAIVDGGDRVGMKFDELRPEEAGRRARLGVLNFTFCSEGRGEMDGGFEGVGFSEASLLKGRIEDIFLSLGVVWRAVKGLLNGSEKKRGEQQRNLPWTTLRIAQILIALLIAVYTLAGVKDTESTPVFCLKERATRPKTSLDPTVVQDRLVRVCVPMVYKLATRFRL